MTDNVQAHVVIAGRVQGVFFRVETSRAAKRCRVSGWVRNKSDGTVEAVFEGPRKQVEQMLDWCRKGAPLARVDRVDVEWRDAAGQFRSFAIVP